MKLALSRRALCRVLASPAAGSKGCLERFMRILPTPRTLPLKTRLFAAYRGDPQC